MNDNRLFLSNSYAQVYDELIDPDLLEPVETIIRNRGFRYGWHSSKNIIYSHWNMGFSATGNPSKNRKDIRSEVPKVLLELWQSIQPIVCPNSPVLIRAYCNAYTYGNDGYVHKDSDFENDMTIIIYLNQQWQIDWAGETVLFDKGEIIHAILPKYRRLIVFRSNLEHVGRSVSRVCPVLRGVLVFKSRPEETEK
jgi:SM-20-related protein